MYFIFHQILLQREKWFVLMPLPRWAEFLKKRDQQGRSPCGIVLRRRSSRRKVAELGARTRDLAGARTRLWTAAILVDTSSQNEITGGGALRFLIKKKVWIGSVVRESNTRPEGKRHYATTTGPMVHPQNGTNRGRCPCGVSRFCENEYPWRSASKS
jgi:hypothetical protein